MKVSTFQPNLQRSLGIVSRAVSRYVHLEICKHILFACDVEQPFLLTLTGTDLEKFISCQIRAQVEEAGAVTMPARLVSDLAGAFPHERVDLTPNGSLKTRLQCGRSKANVIGLSVDEFPLQHPDEAGGRDDAREVVIQPYVLKTATEQVAFAASKDEARPILQGMHCMFRGNTLTLGAADGFRLATRTVLLDASIPEPISVTIPATTLVDVARFCADEAEPVIFGASNEQARFRLAANAGKNEGMILGIDVTAQLLEGNYPDFSRIIPKPETIQTTAVVDRQAFLRALQIPMIFARDNAHVLVLDVQPGKITISAEGVAIGSSVAEVEATVEGDALEISFNGIFLKSAVKALQSARVALDVVHNATAAQLRPAEQKPDDVEQHAHVLMPTVTPEDKAAAAEAARAQEAEQAEDVK